jgi:predicted 3-demethylubiquinone-9 3-methyltransferase (glyoxalase superfamily)
MSKIAPCLWFNGQAEEAAELYTRLFPDSHIDKVSQARPTPRPARRARS